MRPALIKVGYGSYLRKVSDANVDEQSIPCCRDLYMLIGSDDSKPVGTIMLPDEY